MINLGFFSVHIYSICILLGILVGYYVIISFAKKKGYEEKDISDMFFYMIVFGIIGARIYYCLFNYEYYSNLTSVFKVWEGGLAVHGGILFGLISIFIFCRRKKFDFLEILDIVVPGLIIGQAIGRWGNFFNGEAHGMVTTLSTLNSFYLPDFIIKGMHINGHYYVPTFLIESLWCLIGFVIMIIIRNKKFIHVGYLTGFYLIWYGFERFFTEGMRTDSLMFFDIKVAQIVSVFMILIGVLTFIFSYFKRK